MKNNSAVTRPAHRPRQDPTAARGVKSYRVRPDTAEAIADESKRTGLSQGRVIDWLARGLDGQPALTDSNDL